VDPWIRDYPANDSSVHAIQADVMDEFLSNLNDKIHDGTVVPIQKFSREFNIPLAPDFFFLDGDHRYETMLGDIKLALRLMWKGGILAGHDYTHSDWPGVRQAVDEVFPQVHLVDSIWWVYVQGDYSDSNSGNGSAG
jgi:hypothetical protein